MPVINRILKTVLLFTLSVIFAVGSLNSHAFAQTAEDQNTRPNILVIYIDDLHHEKFGFKGDPIIQTPNIDALAEEGVSFQNAFAVTAICITSRGNFMTGQYAVRTGIYFDGFEKLTQKQAQMSFPFLLNEAGYYTGYVGKWHLGPVPEGMFDNDQSFEGQGQFWSEEEKPGVGTHLTDRLGDKAVQMIKEAPEDQPFAITVGFKATHVQDGFHPIEPYPASPSTAVLYETQEMPAPPHSDPEFFRNQPELIRNSLGRKRWEYRLGPPESLNFQRSIRRYYRLVTGIDNQLGKMMEALRQTGKSENTIIVFTADQGMYLGARGLAGKWFGHETSIRIPLIVQDPRMPISQKGTSRDEIALMTDFHPTILEWAGLTASEEVQGRSLVPILQEDTPENWRTEFFYEHHSFPDQIPRSEGVRTKNFKYLRYIDSQPLFEELYDLSVDPTEGVNLAGDPSYSDLLNEMRLKYQQWKEKAR
ncbi:MAG: sulfatase-like hydrolase/transferase [Bacteroidetes bacterium]|nr:sulfatase-like hydrolase/transferase [Bacteroidota bacterium]